MKEALPLFIAILFCSATAHGQPVIMLEDATPAFGTSLTMMSGTYASPGPSGVDQNWNLSGIFADNSNEMTFLPPAGLPGSELFPEATHAASSIAFGEAHAYLSFDNDQLNEVGYISSAENTTVETVFSDPHMQLQFPLEYGDIFSDTYASETINAYIIGQDTTVNIITETGMYDAEVDSYGTLVTPSGTYENILRVIFEIEVMFTVSSNGEVVNTGERITTEYRYYKSGFPVPLATLTNTLFYSEGEQVDQFASGAFMSNISVGLSEPHQTIAEVQFFPVPAHSHLNVSIESEKTQQVHFSLIATDGKEVHNWPARALSTGEQQVELALPEVSEGIYLFRIHTDIGVETRRLVIGG